MDKNRYFHNNIYMPVGPILNDRTAWEYVAPEGATHIWVGDIVAAFMRYNSQGLLENYIGNGEWNTLSDIETRSHEDRLHSAPTVRETDVNTTELYNASRALIDYIIERYHLESEDDLTCPYMQRLAKALEGGVE